VVHTILREPVLVYSKGSLSLSRVSSRSGLRLDLFFNTLQERSKHFANLSQFGRAAGEIITAHKAKISAKQEMIIKLTRRARCNPHKSCQLTAGAAAAAFRQICPDRDCCAPKLACDSVNFFSRKLARDSVQLKRQIMGLAPNLQVPVISHRSSRDADLS